MFNSNLLFYMVSVGLVSSSFMVVVANHAVFSLLFLVISFLLSSILLFLLECEFLALIFILVYVGAIAIFFLFAIMMLESKLNNLTRNTIKYTPIGVVFGLIFLVPLLFNISASFNNNPYPTSFYLNKYQNWFDLIDSTNDIEVYGQILYSYFVLQFLISGLILLLILVGVVYLTNNLNTEVTTNQSLFKQLSRDSNFF